MYKIKKKYIEEMMERLRYIKENEECDGTYETCNECLICDISRGITGNATLEDIEDINEEDMELILVNIRLYRDADFFKVYGFNEITSNEYIEKIVENDVICKL